MLRNFFSTDTESALLAQTETLAVLRFAAGPGQTAPNIQMLELPEPNSLEVWQLLGDEVSSGTHGECTWRRSAQLQFTSYSVDLQPDDDYCAVTQRAYSELLKCIDASPAPRLVRCWNFLPQINYGAGDDENYKRFCDGRLVAFNEFGVGDEQFPAASAVGHHRHGMTICVLSCSADLSPVHHANPRQVDAFHYPRQYGKTSPSFARATTLETADQELCFISGTASILGHSSVHEGDLALQLYTTNDNILYLLEESGFAPTEIESLRVYLRNAEQFEECRRIVSAAYPGTEIVFAEADICRRELLVEIECFCAREKR